MGLPGISIGSLLLILVIVVLIFGTKKLRNAGGDLGGALKNFKTAMKDGDDDAQPGITQDRSAQEQKKESDSDST